MKSIGNRIRALRTSNHMTQAQLAARLGVQYQTVSKWETDVTLPDTMMFPRLADLFGTSIDDLFGRISSGCSGPINHDSAEFLLHTYSQMYAPEAGPWNLSVENKYLEYRFADFFQKHFPVSESTDICNIGIGAGEWDIYLSYQLKGGSLTSIDRSEICCRQLEQRLLWEGNPHPVRVICADAMDLCLEGQFDIVTMVGSTLTEGGVGLALLEKALSLARAGGAVYYQSLDEGEDCSAVIQAAYRCGWKLGSFLQDIAYGFHGHYYRFIPL